MLFQITIHILIHLCEQCDINVLFSCFISLANLCLFICCIATVHSQYRRKKQFSIKLKLLKMAFETTFGNDSIKHDQRSRFKYFQQMYLEVSTYHSGKSFDVEVNKKVSFLVSCSTIIVISFHLSSSHLITFLCGTLVSVG